jgi:uncharacterized protein YndB with AHSA1/START domain
MSNADLARFIDRYTMEFVRIYPHPIERVWTAITDPAELAQWFIAPNPWELRTGGRYRFDSDNFSGVVLAFEPPRLIRFDQPSGGPEDWFQFELTQVEGGTRLQYLQHATPGIARGDWQTPEAWDTPWGGGNLGGWHSGFEELADLLDGVPCGSRRPPTEFSAIARDWAERFGAEFSAEQKAKILRELRERERWFELRKIYRAHVDATLPPATGA